MARLILASGEYATEGEKRAAEELTKLPSNWIVIANKVLPTQNGRSFEIDFIVIGEHLVFAIDEKSWRGRIHGSDAIWVRGDGSSERSPLGKIDYVSKVLAGHLRSKVARFGDITEHAVVGCVLLSGTSERPSIRDPRASGGVLLLSEAVEALQKRDHREGDPRISTLSPAIERALFDLSDRPRLPRQIGPYEIAEATAGPYGSYRLLATHRDDRGPRVLTMYNVASGDPSLREFYLHEYRTISHLSGTDLVPEFQDPFEWSEDFLVVPFKPPKGESLGALPRPGNQQEALGELELARAAFLALGRMHEQGVVHRALSPEAIYVSKEGEGFNVRFTDFFAARQQDKTISPRLDELAIENPYLAPEVAKVGYGFASPESDSYSLALVFLERVSGVPIKKLCKEDGSVRIPEPGEGWNYLPEEVVEALRGFFKAALAMGPMAPRESEADTRLDANGCAEQLEGVRRQLVSELAIERGRLLDNRYRVERVLGTGASARTFLVTDTEADGLFAVKQFLRPGTISETKEGRREFNVLRSFPHSHLPRVFDVYPLTHDVHVKLEYVEGVKLGDDLSRYLGDLESCWVLASDLLAAVEHLETHGILHRDIKPDNVIIRDDDRRAILIDFGSATPVGARLGLAGTPGYLPPEGYLAEEPPPSMDRYALGVMIFRALAGRLPFEDGGNPLDQRPLSELNFLEGSARRFGSALLGAVAADPGERYQSAAKFRAALQAALEAEEGGDDPVAREMTSDWLDSLRGLYRNSARGNGDNRGLDSEFARLTYVPTFLDTKLLPAVFELRPRAVFLSGNPGDGKTAFLEQMRQGLEERGAECQGADEAGWAYQLEDRSYRACYDASEAHGEMDANEQLRAKLEGLEGDELPPEGITVLVAINDGRLADVVERFASEFGWLTGEMERGGHVGTAMEPGGVWTVDLKQRSYISLEPETQADSVMRRMLRSFLEPVRWQDCERCASASSCPVCHNVKVLTGPWGEEVAERLEHLLLISHLRGQKHVTIRDLRSGLAYLITGDFSCEQVHGARESGELLPNLKYWEIAFTTEEAKDILLGELLPLDPGRYAQPELERFLFFRRDGADAGIRGSLFYDGKDLPPWGEAGEWLDQMKRRLYFESYAAEGNGDGLPRTDWRGLLPYRHAGEFLAILAGRKAPEGALPGLIRGLGRSEGLGGPVLDEGLCLSVAQSEVNRLTVLKQFPREQFSIGVKARSAEAIEGISQSLTLTHGATAARLEITLDLFELLMRFANGLEPGSPELRPLLEDMAPFKSTVQMSNTQDLILIEGGRRRHRLTQEGGKVVLRELSREESRA